MVIVFLGIYHIPRGTLKHVACIRLDIPTTRLMKMETLRDIPP
jgi:hypothetical protein